MKQMNKKNLFATICAVIILILSSVSVMMLTGCGNNVTINFNTNCDQTIDSVKVNKQTEYVLPSLNDREGYEFSGWYLNGNLVSSVSVDGDVTVEAKWEKLAKIVLNAEGGSLDKGYVYAKVGSKISDAVTTITPTKANYQFGAWIYKGVDLNKNTKIQSADENIELTAKYKVKYTVSKYKQNLNGEYEKDAQDIEGYEYVGKTIKHDDELGYEVTNHPSSKDNITLSDNYSENKLVIYYNRKTFNVTFRPDYPENSNGKQTLTTPTSYTIKYGEEKQIPDFGFTADGYLLVGWKTQDEKANYKANNTQSLKIGSVEDIESFSASENTSLYGVWVKGYKDMFKGSDVLFLLDQTGDEIYRMRDGSFITGEYDSDDNSFYFSSNKKTVIGKIFSDGTFAYEDASRSKVFTLKVINQTGDTDVLFDETQKITLDEYNGITYYNDSTTSKGTYKIDDDGHYEATYTEGELAGKTQVYLVGKAVDNQNEERNAFIIRNEEDIAIGENGKVYLATVDGGEYVNQNAYDITFSGFGTASFNAGDDGVESYYYSYNKDTKVYTLLDSDNNEVGTIKLIQVGTKTCYVFYDEALDTVYSNKDGSTLRLDGAGKAYYSKSDKNLYYTYSYSMFGGLIATVESTGTTFKFMLEDVVIPQTDTTEESVSHEFYALDKEYGEYVFKSNDSVLYAPMFVFTSGIDAETNKGQAKLYGYDATIKEYVLVSTGTYEQNGNKYHYDAVTNEDIQDDMISSIGIFDGEEVTVALTSVKSVDFGISTTLYTYYLNFWYSYTNYANETYTYATEYIEDTQDANKITITIIETSSMIFYVGQGQNYTSSYTEEDGVISFYVMSQEKYAILDSDNMTFKLVDKKPYKAYYISSNGSADYSKYISYHDGNNAIYTEITYSEGGVELDREEYQGTVTYINKTSFGDSVFQFNDGISKVFKFIEIESGSYKFYLLKDETTYSKYTVVNSTSSLTVDGYSHMAKYNDGEQTIQGNYTMVSDSVIRFIYSSNGKNYAYYFDLKDGNFTVRGQEYGTYQLYNNSLAQNCYLEFDGYGKVVLYMYKDAPLNTIRSDYGEGTYEGSGSRYTVTFDDEIVEGQLAWSTSSDGTVHGGFLVSYNDIVKTYTNGLEEYTLDNIGNVIKTDSQGRKIKGQYVIITDNYMYFLFTDNTSALYQYDVQNSTITKHQDLSEGYTYYTKDFESIVFRMDGMAIYHSSTRYYYEIVNNNVVMYRPAKEGEKSNRYGFVVDNSFASLPKTIVYEGSTYYRKDNAQIQFTRDEDTKYEYPASMSINDNGNSYTGKFPISSLQFTPTGSKEFAVKCNFDLIIEKNVGGKDKIYKDPQGGILVRTYDELLDTYVTYVELDDFFRWYVDLDYDVENDNSSYVVTAMKTIEINRSYRYLYNYYKYYSFGEAYANAYKNEIGTITLFTNFDEDGNQVDTYATGEFGRLSNLTDSNGELISFDYAEYKAEIIDNVKHYTVEVEGTDGITYCLTFMIANKTSVINDYSYIIKAFSRLEEVTVGDYTVIVEKVLFSEYGQTAGNIFRYRLKYQGEDVELEGKVIFDGKTYYVARGYDEEPLGTDGTTITKVTFAVYYLITVTDGVSEINGEIPQIVSATVEAHIMAVYYNEYSTVCIELDTTDNKIKSYSIGTRLTDKDGKVTDTIKTYRIISSEYNEQTGEYTITTVGNITKTIKIDDEIVVVE